MRAAARPASRKEAFAGSAARSLSSCACAAGRATPPREHAGSGALRDHSRDQPASGTAAREPFAAHRSASTCGGVTRPRRALLLPGPQARPRAERALPRVGPVERRERQSGSAGTRAAVEEGLFPLAEGGHAAPPSRLQREEQEAPRSAARVPALGGSAADARWVEGVGHTREEPGRRRLRESRHEERRQHRLSRGRRVGEDVERGRRRRRKRREVVGHVGAAAPRRGRPAHLPDTATSMCGKSRSTSSMASGGNFSSRSCRSQLRWPPPSSSSAA